MQVYVVKCKQLTGLRVWYVVHHAERYVKSEVKVLMYFLFICPVWLKSLLLHLSEVVRVSSRSQQRSVFIKA